MDALFYLLNFLAAAAIVFAWYKITALRKRIPGGVVKAVCDVLGELIGLFALGFLALSLFPLLPEFSREVMVSLVFISTAAFSLIVINFFSGIAAEAGF